jgi:hypothetical protein
VTVLQRPLIAIGSMSEVDEEEQLRESIKNHPHLTLEELREFKELFNLVFHAPLGHRKDGAKSHLRRWF